LPWLLDVNALIALIDSDHVQHDVIHAWFARHAGKRWATTPITENGAVRVLSQPAYPSGQRAPADVIRILRRLKTAHRKVHEFWPDDASLTDPSLFNEDYVVGHRQVTDVYLLGLAKRHGGKLVSFDRGLPWQAIRGGGEGLVELCK
jgi:toxin-antitoxin system PIN domain toxin